MIDAKRLAELMTPEKMRELADWMSSTKQEQDILGVDDPFAAAAAVLREVAGRGEKPLRCGVEGCESEAQTAPLCGKHVKDFMPNMRLRADGAPILSPDKVLEIDLDDPAECIFCDYEQGHCHADHDFDPRPRSCVQGVPEGKTAPEWCPARGRVIVQAKAAGKS